MSSQIGKNSSLSIQPSQTSLKSKVSSTKSSFTDNVLNFSAQFAKTALTIIDSKLTNGIGGNLVNAALESNDGNQYDAACSLTAAVVTGGTALVSKGLESQGLNIDVTFELSGDNIKSAVQDFSEGNYCKGMQDLVTQFFSGNDHIKLATLANEISEDVTDGNFTASFAKTGGLMLGSSFANTASTDFNISFIGEISEVISNSTKSE